VAWAGSFTIFDDSSIKHGSDETSEIGIKSYDVIFSKILATLDFNQYQRNYPRVVQSIEGSLGDIGALVDMNSTGFFSACHQRYAGDNNTLLASVVVLLKRKPLIGFDLDPLYLMSIFPLKGSIRAQGRSYVNIFPSIIYIRG
jgi:hypothetical protein